MHFEILVEDSSGKLMLDELLPKVIGESHTFKVHPYKGIGRIPKGLNPKADPEKRILLQQLPKLIKGYGQTFAGHPENYLAVLFVVCDLDDRNRDAFVSELEGLLRAIKPAPETSFCLAVEEGEAWLLGDLPAVKLAFPKAKEARLREYVNDSICGTWEVLADAVYPGGSRVLKSQGYGVVGAEKSRWAREISPRMIIDSNASPSFQAFVSALRSKLAPA